MKGADDNGVKMNELYINGKQPEAVNEVIQLVVETTVREWKQ